MAAFHVCESGDDDNRHDMGAFFGPGQVDQLIRQSIQMCWMALPKEKRSVDEIQRQLQRLVDRAIRDLREDAEAFGLSPSD